MIKSRTQIEREALKEAIKEHREYMKPHSVVTISEAKRNKENVNLISESYYNEIRKTIRKFNKLMINRERQELISSLSKENRDKLSKELESFFEHLIDFHNLLN